MTSQSSSGSQSSSDVVRESIEAFNSGDAERFAATLAESAILDEWGTQRHIEGRDSIVEAAMGWREAFSDAEGTIQTISACDGTVTAEILWEGTHTGALETPTETISPTGSQVSVRAVQVCTVEEGKLTQVSHYFDMATMLKQLGAFPEPVAV